MVMVDLEGLAQAPLEVQVDLAALVALEEAPLAEAARQDAGKPNLK